MDAWDALREAVGADLGGSAPEVVDQATVDTHSANTGDAQWIHDDTERTRAESPFGAPVVQGFLLLSLLTRHSAAWRFPDLGPVSMMINYGFDRVRFVAPVPVGASVRTRATLAGVRAKDEGRAVLEVDATIEALAGDEAVVAVAVRWLFLAVR